MVKFKNKTGGMIMFFLDSFIEDVLGNFIINGITKFRSEKIQKEIKEKVLLLQKEKVLEKFGNENFYNSLDNYLTNKNVFHEICLIFHNCQKFDLINIDKYTCELVKKFIESNSQYFLY